VVEGDRLRRGAGRAVELRASAMRARVVDPGGEAKRVDAPATSRSSSPCSFREGAAGGESDETRAAEGEPVIDFEGSAP